MPDVPSILTVPILTYCALYIHMNCSYHLKINKIYDQSMLSVPHLPLCNINTNRTYKPIFNKTYDLSMSLVYIVVLL